MSGASGAVQTGMVLSRFFISHQNDIFHEVSAFKADHY